MTKTEKLIGSFLLLIAAFVIFSSTSLEGKLPKVSANNINEVPLTATITSNTTTEEATKLLNVDSSLKMQLALAQSGSFEAQKALLSYQNLDVEALVTICELTLSFDAETNTILEKKILRAELSDDLEFRLAQSCNESAAKGLLMRDSISEDALVIICESLASDTLMCSDISKLQELIQKAFEETTFSSESFVTICKIAATSDKCDVKSIAFQNWLKNTANAVDLTVKQELKIAETKDWDIVRVLINRSKISTAAFLTICEETDPSWVDVSDPEVEADFIWAATKLNNKFNEHEKQLLRHSNVEAIRYLADY